MTIGRTDDPENPFGAQAFQSRRSVWGWIADPIWASGHRPREQAEHMIAIDPPVRILIFPLAHQRPKEPPSPNGFPDFGKLPWHDLYPRLPLTAQGKIG